TQKCFFAAIFFTIATFTKGIEARLCHNFFSFRFQGVVGILASRIKERFHRPVIAFAPAGDGTLKGSG
ncbi:hypothetical protein, partial [Escherichia coli]|uniref:hypothetical protein n=1 Tax=Escherichia coli TaxID=562 RepID=UPI003EE1D36D